MMIATISAQKRCSSSQASKIFKSGSFAFWEDSLLKTPRKIHDILFNKLDEELSEGFGKQFIFFLMQF